MKRVYTAVIGLVGLFLATMPAFASKPQPVSAEMDKLRRLSDKDFNIAFMKIMIMHHMSALAMIKSAPTNAAHAEIKNLAEKNTAMQQDEISKMTGWLQSWYDEQPDPKMKMSNEQQIQAQIARLNSLRGDDYDKEFITDMAAHHQMGVDMAALVAERGSRAELKELAQNIISSQRKDIAEMTGWLKQWYGLSIPAQPAS